MSLYTCWIIWSIKIRPIIYIDACFHKQLQQGSRLNLKFPKTDFVFSPCRSVSCQFAYNQVCIYNVVLLTRYTFWNASIIVSTYLFICNLSRSIPANKTFCDNIVAHCLTTRLPQFLALNWTLVKIHQRSFPFDKNTLPAIIRKIQKFKPEFLVKCRSPRVSDVD